MDINQLCALRIKEIRTEMGLTCQAMADDLGLTIGSYSAIENGKVKITIDRLQQIAKVLQKPMIIFLPSSALSYTFNVSHCDNAITAATYNNYQNKEMSDAVHQALQLMQMVASKMKV
jgi:transcriptional regulator with XRE-family HTH domain